MRITTSPCQKYVLKFARKEEREQKGGYEYKTKHKPRSARNTGRKTGREESRARGGEAQRVEAAARHQGRSTSGTTKIWGLNTGGLSKFSPQIPGAYLIFPPNTGVYLFFSQIPGVYQK